MKKLNNANAITLIALVITIIVLLILAGITINLTIGEHGILNMAKQAGQNYQDATEYEQIALDKFFNEAENIINELEKSDSEAENYKILRSVARPGDYVEYDGGNGYTGLWRVLYNDDTFGLQIISNDKVQGNYDRFIVGGGSLSEAVASYNSAIDSLNNYCRSFMNSVYAVGGRCVGSDPLSPDDTTSEYYTLPFEAGGSYDSGCLVSDENYLTDVRAMTEVTSQGENLLGCNAIYWLASRKNKYLDQLTGEDFVYFSLHWIDTLGELDVRLPLQNPEGEAVMFSSSAGGFGRKPGLSVRPVIALKPDVMCSGDGSVGAPFVLKDL